MGFQGSEGQSHGWQMDSGGVQIRFSAIQSVSGQQGQPQAGVPPKKHPPETVLFLHRLVCVISSEISDVCVLLCLILAFYLI